MRNGIRISQWFHQEFGFLRCIFGNSCYVHRSNKENSEDLWKTSSHSLYRAAKSLRRFWAIGQYIRFDNGAAREARLLQSKAAPILEIWLMLNDNFRKMYRPGANLTVDEQLFPYRGRTRFTQYMPNKPSKYGIKVWWIITYMLLPLPANCTPVKKPLEM